MAIKESQFQRAMRLKAEGKSESQIFAENKSFWGSKNSTFENSNLTIVGKKLIQDYLDYINYSGPSVVKFFSHIYGHDAIITRLQEESSINYSYSSSNIVESASNFTLQNGNIVRPNQDINLINLKANASSSFYNNVIKPTLNSEAKTLTIMQKAFSNISNKDDVVNFFNRVGEYGENGKYETIKKTFPSIREQQNAVLNEYRIGKIIERKSKTKPIVRYMIDPANDEDQKKIIALQKSLSNRFDPIIKELNKVVLDAAQFAYYKKLLTGELINFLTSNGIKFDGINPVQMMQGATTAFEILEIANLCLYLLANKVAATVKNVQVISTGSQFSGEFLAYIETHYGKNYKIKNQEELDEILIGYIKNLPDSIKNKLANKSLESIAATLGIWSGSEASMAPDDYAIQIEFNDGIKEEIRVDAKLGQYNRYTGSINTFGGVKGDNITLEKLLSTEKNVAVEEIKKQIEIALTIFLVAHLVNKETDVDIMNNLTTIIKYAFISSTAIQEKFIKDSKQATLLFVFDQYTWMSTLFFYLYTQFFDPSKEHSRGFSFTNKTISIKKSTQQTFEATKNIDEFMSLIRNNENIQSDIVDLFKKLYQIGVRLSITDMFSSYKTKEVYGTLIK